MRGCTFSTKPDHHLAVAVQCFWHSYAGCGVPFQHAAVAETSSKPHTHTALVRQDQAWPRRTPVEKRKVTHAPGLPWHGSEQHQLISSWFGRGGCAALLEELLAPAWPGPRSDLVPGRGWQSSVLSSQRLQTPSLPSSHRSRNPAVCRRREPLLTFLPYANAAQSVAALCSVSLGGR